MNIYKNYFKPSLVIRYKTFGKNSLIEAQPQNFRMVINEGLLYIYSSVEYKSCEISKSNAFQYSKTGKVILNCIPSFEDLAVQLTGNWETIYIDKYFKTAIDVVNFLYIDLNLIDV